MQWTGAFLLHCSEPGCTARGLPAILVGRQSGRHPDRGETGRGLPSIGVASLSFSSEQTVEDVAEVLARALSLDEDVGKGLTRTTLLFGNLPELDSMAVATVLTALEDRFGILIDDDEVSGELFESVGTLADFIAAKVGTASAN